MKYLIIILLCLSSITYVSGQNNAMIAQAQVTSLTELTKYNGGAEIMLVTDNKTGGLFRYTKEKNTIDNGVVLAGKNKGYWIRVYDKSGPVELAWFGAQMDSTTDDGPALKSALRYPTVRIDGVIAINGKTILPAGNTLEFTNSAGIIIIDTFVLTINSFVKANDYQNIFRGTKKVIFGSNSVPYVSACWFGAVSDCKGLKQGDGNDNAPAINAAIFAAQRVSDLYIPPSPASMSYRIGSTITISKKLHFFSFKFHGGGITLTTSNDDRATTLFADFSEGAAINIQGSRRSYISDLKIHGINTAPKRIGAYDTITVTEAVNNPSNFLSPGIKESYTGITTDAEKDNKVLSADVVFERLQIENFCLGIGISQAGNLQGDRMRIEKCQINYCVYGISVGNAQNRACHFIDIDMTRVWCGVTNTHFGNHSGCMFQMTGGQWCHVFKCFMIQPSYLGQCSINGLYTEAIGSIGVIGDSNPNNSSVIFTGCYFFMRDEGLQTNNMFTPPFYHLWAYGNVTFAGCNFMSFRTTLAMYAGSVSNGYNGSAITMTGCSIHHASSLHIKGNSIVDNTYFIPMSELSNPNRHITADLEGNKRYNTGYNSTSVISGMEYNGADEHTLSNNREIIRSIPRFYTVQNGMNKISNVSYKHDTLTFNYDEQLQKSMFRYVVPGDILGTTLKGIGIAQWDNPTIHVISVDYTSKTVIAKALNRNITFDKIGLYTNSFFVTQPISAELKQSSNVLSNVTNRQNLQPGDFITFKQADKAYRITTINITDSSIVLADPITEDINGRVEIYNELLVNTNDNKNERTDAVRTVIKNETLQQTDKTIIANTSTSDITITLPNQLPTGHTYYIKHIGAEHTVTVKPTGTTIDGQSAVLLKDNYQGLQVLYDGKNYIITGK